MHAAKLKDQRATTTLAHCAVRARVCIHIYKTDTLACIHIYVYTQGMPGRILGIGRMYIYKRVSESGRSNTRLVRYQLLLYTGVAGKRMNFLRFEGERKPECV